MDFQFPLNGPVVGVPGPFPFVGVFGVDLLFHHPPFCIGFSCSFFSFSSDLLIARVEDFRIVVRESILFFNSAVPSSLHSSIFAHLTLTEILLSAHYISAS